MGEDEELVSSLTLTPTPKDRVALPSPQPSGWNTPANIHALRASEVTNGAFSPSVLASGASSPVPESASTATPRPTPPARRPSRGAAAAAKLTGAAAFKRMFGSGTSTPAMTPRTPSTETAGQDSLLNGGNKPPQTPDSESESTSDRFRSNPPSRAQSFSSERPKPPSRPPSVSGDHKFNLKDLLAATPKPARKSSTGGSRKSDAGSERARSVVSGGSGGRLDHYGICERVAIGKGATSIVKLAHKWDRTEEKLYAEFRKRRKNETEKEYVKKLTSEFCISSALHHINVVETVDLVKDENQHWCEVMEYCPGGDLYAAIKRGGMSPSEVECCFKQVLQGVEYLHSQGVAHRDIKPENLFFNQHGHLKIGDYGASTVYRLPWEKNIHMSTGLCGSEPYIAPEQFTPGPYDARLVDIWACGIVYYCLHFQELPWRVAQPSDPLFQTYVTACTTKPAPSAGSNSPTPTQPQLPATISNLSPRACRPLLRRMLDPNPKLRIQIEEIMKDAWLATVEVCTDGKKPGHVHSFAQQRAQHVFEGRGV
ncbi:unnamed protein product [Rhizoctonia solani]|uniref:non-specific serine/threonine protein kinase n=1 Tax=Rhizoctonia solani TaxID=456999 RepID=A0A8H2X6G5_9AGAM|nr:unnamed protein product [Rhizoctonia solani]